MTPRRNHDMRRAPWPLAAAKGARRQRRSSLRLVRLDARRRPPRFFFPEDNYNQKEDGSPTYCSYVYYPTREITINILDDEAREPAVPRTAPPRRYFPFARLLRETVVHHHLADCVSVLPPSKDTCGDLICLQAPVKNNQKIGKKL